MEKKGDEVDFKKKEKIEERWNQVIDSKVETRNSEV